MRCIAFRMLKKYFDALKKDNDRYKSLSSFTLRLTAQHVVTLLASLGLSNIYVHDYSFVPKMAEHVVGS